MKPWEPGYTLIIEANAVSDALRQCTDEIARNRAAIADLVGALKIGEEFVKRHSEPWYKSGQEDLATIRSSIAKHDNTTKESK